MRQYFCRKDDFSEVIGPCNADQLRSLAAEGWLKPDFQVSQDGLKWILASKVRGLQFSRPEDDEVVLFPVDHSDRVDTGTCTTAAHLSANERGDQPFAFLEQVQLPHSRSTDEPFLPVIVAARQICRFRRHSCKVHVDESSLSVVRSDDGSVVAKVRKCDAASHVRSFMYRLKLTMPDTSVVKIFFTPDHSILVSIGRIRAWTAGLSGEAARLVIYNTIVSLALAAAFLICILQLTVTSLVTAVAFTLPRTTAIEHLTLAAGIGVAGLLIALVGIMMKQPWGPMVGIIVNGLGVADTLLTGLMIPAGYSLSPFGIFFIAFRVAVLSSFIVVYYRACSHVRTAARFARRTTP